MTTTGTNLKDLLRSLSDLSVKHAYDPYVIFDWPASLPEDGLWMSADLLSLHGTRHASNLNEQQLRNLSRWELLNFFSFNVHGIRDLMLQVLSCIHTPGYETESEYFHHFLDEENKHMWFFAEFCKRYGGKIYSTQKMQFPGFPDKDIHSFVAFAQILITEQIGDFFNVRMMADENLPPIVRQINRFHHEDENRHIAMGQRVVAAMYERITEKHPEETRQKIAGYLRRYAEFYLQSFYNPSVYRDAGLSDPYELRRELMRDASREEFHQRVLAKTLRFFRSQNLLAGEVYAGG